MTLLLQNDFAMRGFWAHRYPVEHLAVMGDYVASGAHEELKVWQWLPMGAYNLPVGYECDLTSQ